MAGCDLRGRRPREIGIVSKSPNPAAKFRTDYLAALTVSIPATRCVRRFDDFRGSEMGATLLERTNQMVTTSDVQKRKVEGLKARRKPLFDWYEKNPTEIHLVLEIKMIDDEIAECKRQIDHEKRTRN